MSRGFQPSSALTLFADLQEQASIEREFGARLRPASEVARRDESTPVTTTLPVAVESASNALDRISHVLVGIAAVLLVAAAGIAFLRH